MGLGERKHHHGGKLPVVGIRKRVALRSWRIRQA